MGQLAQASELISLKVFLIYEPDPNLIDWVTKHEQG